MPAMLEALNRWGPAAVIAVLGIWIVLKGSFVFRYPRQQRPRRPPSAGKGNTKR